MPNIIANLYDVYYNKLGSGGFFPGEEASFQGLWVSRLEGVPAVFLGGPDQVQPVIQVEVWDTEALFEGLEHFRGGFQGVDAVATDGIGNEIELSGGQFPEALEMDGVDIGEKDEVASGAGHGVDQFWHSRDGGKQVFPMPETTTLPFIATTAVNTPLTFTVFLKILMLM